MERESGFNDHDVVIARADARRRVAEYLRREQLGGTDAERRADEIVSLFGRAPAAVMLAGAQSLSTQWWLFGLRGVLALVFGIVALAMPFAALAALVLVFGVWAFIDGIHALAVSFTGWRSWQMLVVGLVGIAVGLVTFFRPGITALGLYAAVAAWAIARGVLEVAIAVELRRQIRGEWWLILAGVASIIFGVLMVILPAAGILALGWLIGIYALVYGIVMIALAGRLRMLRRPETITPPPMTMHEPHPV